MNLSNRIYELLNYYFNMDENDLFEKIKAARIRRCITNCYSLDVASKAGEIWTSGDDFIFSVDDHGIKRLVFFAKNWPAVDHLLQKIGTGNYYLEFMTKDANEYVPEGTVPIAKMMRLANPDCRSVFNTGSALLQYIDPGIGEPAKKEDIPEINNILWSVFHTEVSHLLYDDELTEKIDQFTIHKENGCIDALLQADVMPKKFYINQVVNKGEKRIIHAILLNRLRAYVDLGGKYLFAWVEESNKASLSFHAKYGMKHDGMWSMVYFLER